ncbi:Uma2 family endonuclease [Oscillatoria sp. CS-180]|uniref:Uma2 family endonuclease n=1 Tax=Oscillatoria sp. CS-180 TaxID=3021720 RepID=UPI00232F2695|nr:Uma2 family endonuclease [Oscillatoria sp. CS-180]MDB9528545.1 Uma2 family endonuclease [Oscillatoria sp. CS-180]
MVDRVAVQEEVEVTAPDVSQLVTEDDTPVDNFASAKQQRLLVSSLYSGLSGSIFLGEANVGIYHSPNLPPIVPDVFVSFDVQVPENWWDKQNRCYMVWNFGKAPEIAIEIVSNKAGNELTDKRAIYEQIRVSYYVVYDPSLQLSDRPLRLFELRGRQYSELSDAWLEQVNLGLVIWEGDFEGRQTTWLRWRDAEGNILLTGDEHASQAQERAEREQERAEREQERAEREQERAEQERARADRLAEYLRSQGIDPDQLPE